MHLFWSDMLSASPCTYLILTEMYGLNCMHLKYRSKICAAFTRKYALKLNGML